MTLEGKYEYIKCLGSGGFSKVYLVRHTIFGEEHALKIMDYNFLLEKLEREDAKDIKHKFNEIKERFINEAKLYKKISHPNIVKIYDVGFVKDEEKGVEVPYLIMRYIKGKSLKKIIDDNGPLKLTTIFKVSKNVLSALDAIHQRGVIHRDIKPGNIIIEDETGEGILIDFGLAKDKLSETTLTVSGSTMGTPAYRSPEQYQGLRNLELETDVYSFGVVLFEMLTGKTPYKGDSLVEIIHGPIPNVREKNSTLPPGIENIIFKALSKVPGNRYRNAAEFKAALIKLEETQKKLVNKEKKKKRRQKDETEIIKEKRPGKRKLSEIIYITAALVTIVIGILTIPNYFKPKNELEIKYKGHIESVYKFIGSGELEKAIDALNKAKQIKDGEEVKNLFEKIAAIKRMRNDFESLKDFVNGEAANTEKLTKCKEFLVKHNHKNVSQNNETKSIVSKIKEIVRQLKFEIEMDESYQKMRKDFKELKNFLRGKSDNNGKKRRAQAFLDKYKNIPPNDETRSIKTETNGFISQLDIEINKEKQYQSYIDTVKKYIDNEDYEKAENTLKKAKEIKDTEEIKQLSETIRKGKIEYEKKHGTKDYNSIKDKLNIDSYLQFKKKYPNSAHLLNLIRQLKSADENLPPEKYWTETIEKNKKGYYEYTFGKEHNGHTMIYIPEKRIWIDKYEVSWLQFRKFLRDEKIKAQPIEDTEYIRDGDEFPAVISFEEAMKYCEKYGLRLPKTDEWVYAAGKGRYTYPWGNVSPAMVDVKGNWRANFDTLDGDKDKDGYKGTAPVKSFEKFSSPFGIVNMVGNVWEWTKEKILKGGGYLSLEDDLEVKSSRKGESYDKEGFRCIKVEK